MKLLAHESGFATLGAGARLDILEAFQLEFGLCDGDGVLLTHTVVCVDLCVSHSDPNGALASTSMLLPVLVAGVECVLALASVGVGDDTIHGGLRPVRLAESRSRVGQAHAYGATRGLLVHFQVVALTMGTVRLQSKRKTEVSTHFDVI